MSETGGKLAALREQARQVVATAPGRAIGQAAREEIEPVIRRLDRIADVMDALPERFQEASDASAVTLCESLAPLAAQVSTLRTSLEMLPVLLAQQTDGVVAQIQAEGLTMRQEIGILRQGMATLPDALAQQVVPIVLMAERLDQVIVLQRSSLVALHEESLAAFRSSMEPTTERVEAGLGAVTKQVQRTASMLGSMKALPDEVRTAAEEARRAGTETAQAIRSARGTWRRQAAQVAATAVLAAGLVIGGQSWLGTQSSNRLPPFGGESAKVRAWDTLRQQASPELGQAMDSYLASSAVR